MVNNNGVREKLLRDHPASAQGTWQILGEDPNCDLGGPHHQPELATVTGTYENVVDYALTLKGFFSWGGGGRIVPLNPPTNILNVDKLRSPAVKALEDERRVLQKRLSAIETELQNLLHK